MNDIATRSTDDLRVHLGLAQVALRYGQTLKARRQGLEAIEAIREEFRVREAERARLAVCTACQRPLYEHPTLRLWRCLDVRCVEFDRWQRERV